MTKARRRIRSLSGGSADPQCQALPPVNPAPILYMGTWSHTPCHKFPYTRSRSMGAALSQAVGPPAPKPAPTPTGFTRGRRIQQCHRDNSRTVWAHLPPHHSEGQSHGPGVVDDVSSHLGLQEGALSQAPVLVSRDLLGHPRERDQSATEKPLPPPPSRQQACHSQLT